jgi:hypothetical protein
MNIATGKRMNLWIRILISFFWLTDVFGGCDFRPPISKVFSLSGPITVALRDMGLLKNAKVKGISLFHPVDKNQFQGKFFPGGIFLSRQVMEEFSGSLLFFDESHELSKTFSPLSSIQSIEMKTRNLIPMEVTLKVIKELAPFLMDCSKELKAWEEKSRLLENKVLAQIKAPISILFFLGDFKNNHPPELLIVNDGIVKWLIQRKKIKTYPSELAYVNWSSRLIRKMPASTYEVAVKDSGSELIYAFNKKERRMTFNYPGSLIPGVSQLEAWDFLFKHIWPR